jgi:hypothetical protein
MLKDPGGMKNMQPGAMMPGMGAGQGNEVDQEMMDQAGEIMKGMRGE